MNLDNLYSHKSTLFAFLAGAAVGAVVIALTTPKKGADLRKDLTGIGRRAKGGLDAAAQQGAKALDDLAKGTACAHSELKRSMDAAARDLQG